MPYDDDSSRFGFRDWEDFLNALTRREAVTFTMIQQALEALNHAAGHRNVNELSMREIRSALANQGLGNLQFDVVAGLVEAASSVPRGGDILSQLTVRDLQKALQRR